LRRAAGYVDRILKGEKAGRPSGQAPTRAAKALGLIFPPTLLARAGQVIE
jgi:putative ABC transport system substrate-binding protein